MRARPAVGYVVAALGAAALAAAGALLWRHDALTYDVGIYRGYGEQVAAGRVPYRDFPLEYPPGALPAFVAPALVTGSAHAYRVVFAVQMAAVEVAALLVGLALVRRRGATPGRQAAYVAAAAAIAAAPLGSVALTRFDLWPALLLVAALAALSGGRLTGAGALVGLGAATKVFPAVALVPACVWAWRRAGGRGAVRLGAAAVVAAALVLLPFVALAPRGVASSLWGQVERPLQIESLGAAVVIALHRLAGVAAASSFGHGSYNLTGTAASAATAATAVALALALASLWTRHARERLPDEGRTIAYAAACVAAFVAFGKVLSPQFLLWLVPLVPLLAGGRGAAATLLLAAAAGLTAVWIPFRQTALVDRFAALPSWSLLARDLLLVALVLATVPPGRPAAARGVVAAPADRVGEAV